ncbi:hypothetical protein A2943_00455 [Candidatus Adlerbacteria bacterium RIFCSPLOWO2_01_FULL_51_16]|uniref:Fibronectin type-III domain-containing protein n=1 Tax=Candidatus Adlerbacteria bacterium RIFCSPLOWO2_01_FULL_51_16 TaxID=1797243 RepID=A0A1F4XJC6_9BACT|nr:MAG: hypothetical protein A2943_00455 [Candidatus Adlerbacteria bacterium RIFCSPLOWO2_01_FULL_51_16]
MKQFSHKKLRDIALLCAGAALLVVAAVFLSSPIPPSNSPIALPNIFPAGYDGLAAATWLGVQQGYPSYSGYPMPVTCFSNNMARVPSANPGLPICESYNLLGIFSAHPQSSTAGASQLLRRDANQLFPCLGTGGAGCTSGAIDTYDGGVAGSYPTVVSGGPATLEWSCQDYQDIVWNRCFDPWCATGYETEYATQDLSNGTQSSGFSTGGGLVGAATIYPTASAWYSLTCKSVPIYAQECTGYTFYCDVNDGYGGCIQGHSECNGYAWVYQAQSFDERAQWLYIGVTAPPPPAPTMNLYINRATPYTYVVSNAPVLAGVSQSISSLIMPYNDASSLSWSTANVVSGSCRVYHWPGHDTSARDGYGTQLFYTPDNQLSWISIGNLTQSTSYTLWCTGLDGYIWQTSVVAYISLSAPAVTTNAASNVTSSSATINGTANPNGNNSLAWLRYSSTNPGTCNNDFGTWAGGYSDSVSGSSPVPFSRSVSGLTPDTSYYFCGVINQSSGGTGPYYGSVLSFTTLSSDICTDLSGIQTSKPASCTGTAPTCVGATQTPGPGSGNSATCVTTPTISSFVADPSRVRKGDPSELSWTVQNPPASCTIFSAPPISGFPANITTFPSGILDTGAINQRTEFTLSCGSSTPVTKTVTIIPTYIEI